jgi:hypothetical protein
LKFIYFSFLPSPSPFHHYIAARENSSEIDMGDTIELIRELLKKRADEMPSVRVAVRNGWKFLAHGMSITFQELIAFLPIYDAYFKHQVIEKLKKEGSKDGLGFDPTIFI